MIFLCFLVIRRGRQKSKGFFANAGRLLAQLGFAVKERLMIRTSGYKRKMRARAHPPAFTPNRAQNAPHRKSMAQNTPTTSPLPAPLVAVALSGGADSLYTLLSLHEAGVKVMGIHGLFGGPLELGTPEENALAQANSTAVIHGLSDACHSLGIPFAVRDCSQEFMDAVVRPFVESYARGHTPNPCALCNAAIKFGLLREHALAAGASHIATGHYARLVPEASLQIPHCACTGDNATGTGLALLQGADPTKDQSYFLALVKKEFLASALFPLGNEHKNDVLARLAARGITPPQRIESQEVCFIPHDEYRDFLPRVAARLGIQLSGQGPMMLADGRIVGQHKGLWQYTEGQRKGLGVGWSEPLHVLGKEAGANILRLGPRVAMRTSGCVCAGVNVLVPQAMWPTTVYVKTRYRERAKAATATLSGTGEGTRMHITFHAPETIIAHGQIAAVYMPVPGCFEPDGRPLLRLAAGGIIAPEE